MVRLVKPARNYSSRREQWRLLLLIVPLGLVIVLMARLRDPQTADRINRFFADVEQPQPPAAAVSTTPTHGLFPGVRRELLASIRDNTYFRNSETEAWFQFIDVLQRTPAEQLSSAHGVPADYTQLIDQSEAYRGRLVSVHGSVRQVTEQKPAANDLGVDSYYRVVVQPADGVQWPIFVYCLELPPGLSVGDNLEGIVKVAGLFFKNLSYQWRDGLGTAPVILARSIEYVGLRADEPMDGRTDGRPKTGVNESLNESTDRGIAFQDVLSLAGWNVERLAEFDDAQAFSDDQRRQAIELLRRLRSFDSASLDDWAHDTVAPNEVINAPANYRGQLVRLKGQVVAVTRHALGAAEAERLEMPEYFESELELNGDAGLAIVLTTRVPRAWQQIEPLSEPVTVVALYIKRVSMEPPAEAVWLAKEVAWQPTAANEPYVSFGESVLGTLGMDVGLLDDIARRGRIRAAEREAFYQMLDAAGRIGAQELIRLAEGNLPVVRESWEQELATAKDQSRRTLATGVVERAAAGQYSVAALFNDPGPQIGRLLVVDGASRRVARVEVGSRPAGEGASDVARRFGIDHYYEMEVFTEDSQNYPLVFCVRDLPAGFPTGGSIHVPVRVAGFFFKDWLYHTRGSRQGESAGGRGQFAPLLIGRAPLVLAIDQGGKDATQLVLGCLFVAALGGIWGIAAWYARGDRRFREQMLASRLSLPPGQSLNEIKLPAADEPMKE